VNSQLPDTCHRERPERLDASAGESSAEPLGSIGDRNFEGEHREPRKIAPTTFLEAGTNKQETTAVHPFLVKVDGEWDEVPPASSDVEDRPSIGMSRMNACVDRDLSGIQRDRQVGQDFRLQTAMMQVERVEALQGYDPIRCHVIDSRAESRKPKMTELRCAKQEFEEIRYSVLVANRHGMLGAANEREGCQGAEMFRRVGDDITQQEGPKGYEVAG
jgi:hypothetical protein